MPAPTIISTASIERTLPLGADRVGDDGIGGVGDGDGLVAQAGPLALVEQHGSGFEVVHAAEVRAVAERPVHRRGCDAEHALDLVHQLERILRGLIELVDERQHRDGARPADLEQLQRLRLDAFGGVEHHDDAVDGQQRAIGVFAEILVARRVEQRDVVPVELELERGGADRDAALLLHLHPVGGGVTPGLAAAHRARELDRAGVQQQLLGQRRLARVGVGNDREGAATANLARKRVGDESGLVQFGAMEHGTIAQLYCRTRKSR